MPPYKSIARIIAEAWQEESNLSRLKSDIDFVLDSLLGFESESLRLCERCAVPVKNVQLK